LWAQGFKDGNTVTLLSAEAHERIGKPPGALVDCRNDIERERLLAPG
jgi:hypothetical protein